MPLPHQPPGQIIQVLSAQAKVVELRHAGLATSDDGRKGGVCMASGRQGGLLGIEHKGFGFQLVCVLCRLGCPRAECQPREGAVSRTLDEEPGLYSLSSPLPHISRLQCAGAQLVRYRSSERKMPFFAILANVPAIRVIFLL